ncbi:hypothetical protein AB0H43_03830 [Hamadaea sp. NPDC050747]|uniref:hypothetical protein n=1 Tax=Hamadaea sp. NPDC050747 TaxID=3155789 RepID=UPI0033E7154D
MITISTPRRVELSAPARPAWSGLFSIAAIAALASAVLLPIQIAVFVAWPPPLDGGAADWFALLQDNRLAGLIDLDLLLVVDNILLVPILLALFLILRRASASMMLVATAAGLLGVVMYATMNPAIQMSTLSDDFATATSAEAKASAVAAGEAALAAWQGTAFHVGYLLGSLAGIVIGIAMLRSAAFSKVTAWMAIAANAVGLGLYLPGIGVFVAVFSVLFLEIWYVLVARALWGHAKRSRGDTAIPAGSRRASGPEAAGP